MASQAMICNRCEQEKPPATTDDAFCQECFNHIDRMMRDPLYRVRAAVCYINNQPHRKLSTEVAAFMAIFHPDAPASVVQELCRQEKT